MVSTAGILLRKMRLQKMRLQKMRLQKMRLQKMSSHVRVKKKKRIIPENQVFGL